MTRLLVLARIWSVRLAFRLASFMPLRRRAVLATAHLARLDGNLACIRRELAARRRPVPVTALAFRAAPGVLGLLRTALNEVRAAYHLATSRVFIVDDYFFPIYAVRPRSGTTIIQAWHACGAFKKFGRSVSDKGFGATDELTRRVPIHANYDVCLVSSPTAAVAYAEAFGQPLDRFVSRLGIPRTDLLFGDDRVAETRRRLRERYAIPAERRVVLYAPTFRGERSTAARHPQDLDLRVLHATLGADHVLLVRLHPYVRAGLHVDTDMQGFVIDVSDHPEVNELMLISDALVTDYSSVIFEFSLLGRPIAFFAPDHAAYERERGFYFDYRADGPGPVFETTADLAGFIRSGQFDMQRVERFRQTWFEIADGRSTERVVNELILPALAGDNERRPGGLAG